MKKNLFPILMLSTLLACHSNSAKVESAATDSITASPSAKPQPTVVKKEVHYVNTEAPSQPEKKKGWSSAAKGAVIGGAAGGVTGAVVDKKHRLRGAAIGTAVGAGAGYLFGRHKDKKKRRRN
jgi:outer membrane lipoprotein SlyB